MAEQNNQHHHHHHHHQHGGSNDSADWTEKNRAYWDKAASTYNAPGDFTDLVNKVNAFILSNINWFGVPFRDPSSNFESQPSSSPPVRVLDYACGPGNVTAALAGYATEYVGIDISQNMVNEYNKRFERSTTSTDAEKSSTQPENLSVHAVVGNLLDQNGPSPHLQDEKYFGFDLAGVSGGFHHFENVELATQRLVDRLKPGGVLMIFDFLSHAPDDLQHDAVHTVVHHGFDEKRVHELFGGAGLTDVDILIMKEQVTLKGMAARTGFLAKGKKPQQQ